MHNITFSGIEVHAPCIAPQLQCYIPQMSPSVTGQDIKGTAQCTKAVILTAAGTPKVNVIELQYGCIS